MEEKKKHDQLTSLLRSNKFCLLHRNRCFLRRVNTPLIACFNLYEKKRGRLNSNRTTKMKHLIVPPYLLGCLLIRFIVPLLLIIAIIITFTTFYVTIRCELNNTLLQKIIINNKLNKLKYQSFEGEPWHSSKVVPWWSVGHGFKSGNNLFAYAKVGLRTMTPHPCLHIERNLQALRYVSLNINYLKSPSIKSSLIRITSSHQIK